MKLWVTPLALPVVVVPCNFLSLLITSLTVTEFLTLYKSQTKEECSRREYEKSLLFSAYKMAAPSFSLLLVNVQLYKNLRNKQH